MSLSAEELWGERCSLSAPPTTHRFCFVLFCLISNCLWLVRSPEDPACSSIGGSQQGTGSCCVSSLRSMQGVWWWLVCLGEGWGGGGRGKCPAVYCFFLFPFVCERSISPISGSLPCERTALQNNKWGRPSCWSRGHPLSVFPWPVHVSFVNCLCS